MSDQARNLVREDQWIECASSGDESSRFWPVVEYGEPPRALGLTPSGAWMWCDLVAAKMYSLSPPDAVGVLPVLELPYGVVRERAHVTARAAGVPAELIMSELPGQVIVETALSSRSDYWVDLAAGWLRDMPAEQVPFGAIEEAAHDTALPQSSRHGLLRALSQVRSR